MNRTQNASRNILWGVIERVIIMLMPFFTRTIMIKTLGAEYLGLNSLFTSILQVLSISELGFGTAIVFSLYKPIADDDNVTLCAFLNVYRNIYNIIGTIILIGGLVTTPFLKYLITGDYPKNINIYILFLIYLINTVISYYLFAYKAALFSAYQRNDLISKRTAFISFVSNCFQIIVLLILHNYYVYVIIMPIATIFTNLANAYLAKKMFPDVICKGNISEEAKESLKKRIFGLVSYKVYGAVFTSVDTMVISAFLGLVPLAIFNNYSYVQTAIVGFMTVLSTSITAGVGNKMITNTIDENYEDFKKLVLAKGWICSWCAICLFCLYQPFMEWWVGEELMFPFSTMCLFVWYFLLPQITNLSMTYREAAGLWWEDRYRPLVSAVINLVTNILLVQYIGMNGVILSTLICTIFINVPWGTSILFKRYFNRSSKEYFRKLLFYIICTAFVGMITSFICNPLPNGGLIWLLAKGIICTIVPNILLWLLYHRLPEYIFVKNMINKVVAKIKVGKNLI